MTTDDNSLTGRNIVARNTLWNLVGTVIPLAVAILCTPVLTRGLGTERFGILTLVWMMIGYLSLFDLGIGSALTKLVADKLGEGKEEQIPSLVWTSLFLMAAFGLAGMVVMILFTPAIVENILKITLAYRRETLHAFYLLAVSIPIVILTAGLRGILAAKQCFRIINYVRIPMGIFMYLGPLIALPFSRSVLTSAIILFAGRVVACAVHFAICFNIIPQLGAKVSIHRFLMKDLLSLGGWITISNVISPLMNNMDRFFIGAWISVQAVAYYGPPCDLATRLNIIPVALSSVLFPAFATSYVQGGRRTSELFMAGVKYTFIIMFPIVFLFIAFANEGLNAWLGPEFSRNSTRVLQWLSFGVLFNCLAQIPFVLLQGIGKPNLTAKLHLAEVPLYFLLMWGLVRTYGIEGMAIAWTVRAIADALFLFLFSVTILKGHGSVGKTFAGIFGCAVIPLFFMVYDIGFAGKVCVYLAGAPLFLYVSWRVLIPREEKARIRTMIFKYSPKNV